MTLRIQYILPVAVFLVVAGFAYYGLFYTNPRVIPTALKDKPVPDFALPPVEGRTLGLASADLKSGEVSIVNVFASWCVPCRVEHPLLMGMKDRAGVPIHGLNYKDAPRNAAQFLEELGDPYRRTGADRDGRVGIDWGVYGVPETFVVTKDGRIACKHIGPLTADDIASKIMPLVEDLKAGMNRTC